jgi:hypothetical protein
MIAWVKKAEKIKAKQARKLFVVNTDDESGRDKSDSGGNGRKNLKKRARESKRDLGDVKVGDALAMVRMEMEVEKLATKEAEAEARASRNLRKKQKKEPEVGQKVCGKGKVNRKGKGNTTSTSKSKPKSKPKDKQPKATLPKKKPEQIRN